MSGDFSANVLQAALERAWGLSCSDTRSPDKKAVVANPTAEDGFLCNLEDHWIALRKIDGSWWNLNSLEDVPQYLSDLYLGVFLKQLEIEGWTIYVVQGEFPAASLSRSGQEWRFCQPGTAADKRSTPSDFEDSIGNEDAELEAALIASLADAPPAKQTPASAQEPAQEYIDDDEELRLAIEMSKQMDAEAGEESK
jgi:ataxin-3